MLQRSRFLLNNWQYIQTKQIEKVGLITLHRPKALNALCTPLFDELIKSLKDFDKNPEIGCIVITGNKKAYAAGADIKEMKDTSGIENYKSDFLGFWQDIGLIRKPIISAVNGYCLGGGCELAQLTDIIYAGETAMFGQPEIKLGISFLFRNNSWSWWYPKVDKSNRKSQSNGNGIDWSHDYSTRGTPSWISRSNL